MGSYLVEPWQTSKTCTFDNLRCLENHDHWVLERNTSCWTFLKDGCESLNATSGFVGWRVLRHHMLGLKLNLWRISHRCGYLHTDTSFGTTYKSSTCLLMSMKRSQAFWGSNHFRKLSSRFQHTHTHFYCGWWFWQRTACDSDAKEVLNWIPTVNKPLALIFRNSEQLKLTSIHPSPKALTHFERGCWTWEWIVC